MTTPDLTPTARDLLVAVHRFGDWRRDSLKAWKGSGNARARLKERLEMAGLLYGYYRGDPKPAGPVGSLTAAGLRAVDEILMVGRIKPLDGEIEALPAIIAARQAAEETHAAELAVSEAADRERVRADLAAAHVRKIAALRAILVDVGLDNFSRQLDDGALDAFARRIVDAEFAG